jgi:paraquat-inducible protein B
MNLKSEKSIKEYLKTLPDDTIIKYYLDVEYTPFPVLLIEEYSRRFKQKTKNELVKDLKFQTNLAKKKSLELNNLAKKQKLVDDVTKEKSEEIIQHAKKKGYEFSQRIANKSTRLKSKLKNKKQSIETRAIKKFSTSKSDYLDLLEKLGNLKKAGIITSKEFEEKKKKILSKI